MALDSPVDLGFPIGQSVKLSEGRYQVVHMGGEAPVSWVTLDASTLGLSRPGEAPGLNSPIHTDSLFL